MPTRTYLALAAIMLMACTPFAARAAGLPTIRLTATRQAVLSDGKDATDIIAEPRDGNGNPMPDGTEVTFSTNLGNLTPGGSVTTRGGAARVRLSGQQNGVATVQAVMNGGGFNKIDITFTDNPADTFQGNAYVAVQSVGSLLYDADDRVIDAVGRPHAAGGRGLPGAHATFRDVDVHADSLQIDCQASALRATGNVLVQKGAHRLLCARLYYPLLDGDAFAITEMEGKLRPAKVDRNTLATTPLPNGLAPIYFEMTDTSAATVVITARQILLFPGDKLQFKRPRFYQNGQAMVSMAFYSQPLYSNQLFSDQFLSVGTEGFSMDMPLYYDLTPASTGIFHIRHGERSGRSSFATQPGWSLDLVQGYNSVGGTRRFTGEFGLTGVSGTDWGARWSHSQEFNQQTQGSFFIDLPQHRSLLASTSLSHQLGFAHTGMSFTANQSLSGIATHGFDGSFYVESTATKVGRTGYMMAVGANTLANRSTSLGYSYQTLTQTLNTRFTSRAFVLSRTTTVSNSFIVGQQWSDHAGSGLSLISSLSAFHNIRRFGRLQLTYDYSRLPLTFVGQGQHRLGASLYASGRRWDLSLFNTFMPDVGNLSSNADFSYSIMPRWRFSLMATLQRFSSTQYRDYEFSLARTIGGRDLVLSYSTYTHRMFLDLQASRF